MLRKIKKWTGDRERSLVRFFWDFKSIYGKERNGRSISLDFGKYACPFSCGRITDRKSLQGNDILRPVTIFFVEVMDGLILRNDL